MKVKLKELCANKNITLYQLANEIGVDRNTVYTWGNNTIFPRAKQLDKLLEYFDCKVQELIEKN